MGGRPDSMDVVHRVGARVERDVGGASYAGRMMPLGTRVVPEDATLEARIAARLDKALDAAIRAGFEVLDAERGLAVVDHDVSELGVIRLSVADVARIAAQAAREWW